MRASRLAAAAVVLGFVVVLLWLVSRVLTPFLIAIAVAAVLDPPLQRLQSRGLPRRFGVLIVYVVFFALTGSLLFWLVPSSSRKATRWRASGPLTSTRRAACGPPLRRTIWWSVCTCPSPGRRRS